MYSYDSSTGWQHLSTFDPQQLLSWGEKLVVILDTGVYAFEPFAGFRHLSTFIPERTVALEQMLVLDFGPEIGIYTTFNCSRAHPFTSRSWARIRKGTFMTANGP